MKKLMILFIALLCVGFAMAAPVWQWTSLTGSGNELLYSSEYGGNVFTCTSGGATRFYIPSTDTLVNLNQTCGEGFAFNYDTVFLYVGLGDSVFSYWDSESNTWTDLSGKDDGWVNEQMTYLLYDADTNKIYTVFENHLFGAYNPSTDNWTQLSSYSGSGHITAMIMDISNNVIIAGTDANGDGMLKYNISSNSWSGVSSPYNEGTIDLDSYRYYDEYRPLLYVAQGSGKFFLYNTSLGTTTDLSSTDAGDWAGESGTVSAVSAFVGASTTQSDIVFTVNAGGMIGLYNKSSNTWINILNVSGVTDLAYDMDNEKIYTGGNFGVITFDEPPLCTPNWSCSGYGACNASDLRPCNETVDLNNCSIPYNGTYGEFTPQACDYCTPDWVCIGYAACVAPMSAANCTTAADINVCNESYAGNYSEFTPNTCTYPLTDDALIAKNNNTFINILVIMLIVGILGMITVGALTAFGIEVDMTIIAAIAAAVVVLAVIILLISFGSITSLT